MNNAIPLLPIAAALLCIATVLAKGDSPSAKTGVEVLFSSADLNPNPAVVNEPFSVAFAPDGTMFGVEFTKGNRVYKIDAEGKVQFIAGQFWQSGGKKDDHSPNDGLEPMQARFDALHDIAITSSGDAILAETYSNRIRKLNLKTGEVSTLAGDARAGFAGDGGSLRGARFSQPYCCSLSPDDGAVYVADLLNSRVRELDFIHDVVRTVAGNGKKGPPVDGAKATATPLNGPRACAVASDGTLYIVQREGNSLLAVKDGVLHVVVNASGAKGYSGDGGPAIDAKLNGPKYICVDPFDNVILCDTENHCVRRYEPKSGKIVRIAGIPPTPGNRIGSSLLTTQLQRPHGARFDKQGRLYVIDSENNRVLRAAYP